MKTIPLITLLTESFTCSRSALQDKINHPLASNKLLEILSGKRLQTNYFDRNGKKKEVKCAAYQFYLQAPFQRMKDS